MRKALLIAAVAMVAASPALAVSEDEVVFQVLALVATSIVAGGKCNLHATDVAFLKAKADEIASAAGLDLADDQVQLAAAELISTTPTLQQVMNGDRQATIDFCAGVKKIVKR
jgi:predicted RecA/RadA family phage recombinase